MGVAKYFSCDQEAMPSGLRAEVEVVLGGASPH
jgi:hypothetical protein